MFFKFKLFVIKLFVSDVKHFPIPNSIKFNGNSIISFILSISFLLNKFYPRKINFKFLKFFNAEKISGEEILFLNRYNFSNLGNSNFLNISIQSLPKLLPQIC